MKCVRIIFIFLVFGAIVSDSEAQPKGFNYDESKVPEYTLPDPLVANDGSSITSPDQWTQSRRSEILKLFEQHVYGRQPGEPGKQVFEITSLDKKALGGRAIRKEVTIRFEGKDSPYAVHVLMYIPKDAAAPPPVFLGYNFNGNHTIHADPGITLSTAWMRRNGNGNVNHRATEEARGASSSRWPVEAMIERGFALATAYYGDIEPDHKEGWKDGIRSYYKTDEHGAPLKLTDWSAISAWAWGLSRIMDYLETDKDINAGQVAVMGHSRLGKTALWAGATDERFAITISNNSGCGGAALSRRAFGETVKRIDTSFPHWFCDGFSAYHDNEAALPVDQHQLIALMAPRPVYVASAKDDLWADPMGEFLAAKAAGPVYALFGKDGVGVENQPKLNQPVGDVIGYHIRTGEHDVTDFDWNAYMDFAERHFTAAKPGIYGLWYGGTSYGEKAMALPYVVGGQLVVQWGSIETGKGEYDFGFLDEKIREVAGRGLNFTIQFNGNIKPSWMYQEIPYNPHPLSVQVRDDRGSLMWWHPTFRKRYRQFLEAMAEYIAQSPFRKNIIGIRMNFNAFGTEHTHVEEEDIPLAKWIVPEGCDRSIEIVEWSPEVRADYISEVVRNYVRVFSGEIKVFIRNTVPAELEEEFKNDFESGYLAWFHTSSEAEPRAGGWAEVKYGRFYDYARAGKTVAFAEPWASAWGHHGPKTDDRWCSPPQWNYWRLLIDLHCGISYIGVYASDLRVAADGKYGYGRQSEIYRDGPEGHYQREFDAAFRFASKYVGYHDKPRQAPGAWVAFRESNHVRAANGIPKQRRILKRFNGDYDFLMKRLEDKSYGQDVVNIGPDYQRYGAFARVLPAGEKMQLLVDPDFAKSLEGKTCEVRITYYDRLGDTFTTKASGSEMAIECSGLDMWKTATLAVEDASLINSGTATVEILAGDQDICLHMLEILRK
ncbi:MAG: beta-galactosidase [Puniceicoccaceae bacterium]